MLDLNKVASQMQGIGEHLQQESQAAQKRLESALDILQQAIDRQAELVAKQKHWRDRMAFTAAQPLEPLDKITDIPKPPESHTVIATDGSQISPSHHEIAYCYLINIGRVVLHYGQSRYPLLDSLPEVYYRAEDLYASRQWGIQTEEWMGYQRVVSEIEALSELASALASQQPTYAPMLALVDGSLIYWFLDNLPNPARDRILEPILIAWRQMQQAGVPLLGYISASRNRSTLNFLRLPACPYIAPDCLTHCLPQQNSSVNPSPPPCQLFDPLRDTSLWGTLLEPGQRSPLWRSWAKVLDRYEQPINFCYLHAGTEIARVEMPAWVAREETTLNRCLGLVLAQVQKGYGYPVALAEAHNQAVVRGGDRQHFFAMLEQKMIEAGMKNVGTSYKETRKRGSVA
ncbi:DNA double-strand break repair nuclease NurA [Geitlerinema sp. PCC 9228]|jgi:hypothetical protein|uniref:DNA double-strand break repair nuclease NurA n=1 Tax=Geitlerinema sp. PCC 9228 TaxID=111611 RepID=UPI0008F9C0D6|nr:DNA double-strand break repair nuclease NurA [Geitlerinema sp. PCC 9228]